MQNSLEREADMPLPRDSEAGFADDVLSLRGLTKRYGSVLAVDDADLRVRRGEFLTLLGPSGSGKTTILKMVAGFESRTSGEILLDGKDIAPLSPAERNIGIVFQNYALFPHMTVRGNVRYPLKLRRWKRQDADDRVAEMLQLVRLDQLGPRYPRELSGGQQQRVAFARALAFQPKLLLMDEPLGALDRALRIEMEEEIRRIHRVLGTTIVYVTHDQEEALALSDRIAVMRDGKILQVGHPRHLFEYPSDAFVASFFGDCTLLKIERLDRTGEDGVTVHVADSSFRAAAVPAPSSAECQLMIRPHHLHLEQLSDSEVRLTATVTEIIYLGDATRLRCTSPHADVLVAKTDPDHVEGVEVGHEIALYFDGRDALVIPKNAAN
jgi:putative spermidine/putrescine transport system ATP-binding protein